MPSTPAYVHKDARTEFLAGVRAELPILLGVAPFGLIYGVLALQAGLSTAQAQAMSSIVFAGSSQFIGVQLFAAGTPAVVMVLTTLVVNLRHALYSASIAPHLRHLPARWKAGLAYLLTDEAYAVSILYFDSPQGAGPHRHWHLLGSGLMLWGCWQLSTLAGILLGSQVPAAWGLDFALPLTFIALVGPALRDRAAAAAALAAGAMALLAAGLPLKLGLITAVLMGVLTGLVVESNFPGRRA